MGAIKVVPAKFFLFANLVAKADHSRQGICPELLFNYHHGNESLALTSLAHISPTWPLVRLAAQCIGRLYATGYLHVSLAELFSR